MKTFLAAALAAIHLAAPAGADEVEDALEAALDAYRAGDMAVAQEEIDYAGALLSQMKAEGLAGFLPEAMEGWTREDGETQALGAAMFGGGMTAEARYVRDDRSVTIALMADNPMVAAMAGMFENAAALGSIGKVKRINRQKVVITPDGELQALVGRRIMVSIDGDAPIEDKEAYFAAIDAAALKEF